MLRVQYEETIRAALLEDMRYGDLATEAIVHPQQTSRALITAKQDGVIAGMEVAGAVFEIVDARIRFAALVADGTQVHKGEDIARVQGPTGSLLMAERTALNFLQRLSGIATSTRQAVEAVKDYRAVIVDTRKTTPGMRALEKYAVAAGGGRNHRFTLSDAAMIKDNHIQAAGGIRAAVERVRAYAGLTVKVEVEAESLEQVEEALTAGADIVMLDNMPPERMRQAVDLIAGRVLSEASGGITLDQIAAVAASGVDYISLGWLTHSLKSMDLSMNFLAQSMT
ncbi:MAG: carboxylating nicotinate-nucleotide diphosphorylase [Peptococcaceae bacterium]|jgi:nicotinate-nucleotide pyrophosphorylase (carboxylating)|nr:carboxylating nicotinate-nucleotide diphosphorylase [Peptococcaceae bacterium]